MQFKGSCYFPVCGRKKVPKIENMNVLLILKLMLQIFRLTQQQQNVSGHADFWLKSSLLQHIAQKNSGVMKNQSSYFRYLCKMKHLVIDKDSERLLILSDSHISNSWKCNNDWQHPGTEKLGLVKGHINMEVKRGATISDLTNILIEKYLNVHHMSLICWR